MLKKKEQLHSRAAPNHLFQVIYYSSIVVNGGILFSAPG